MTNITPAKNANRMRVKEFLVSLLIGYALGHDGAQENTDGYKNHNPDQHSKERLEVVIDVTVKQNCHKSCANPAKGPYGAGGKGRPPRMVHFFH